MKKRKLLLTALCLAGATACFLASACNDDKTDHDHTYSEVWTYSQENVDLGHWHECTHEGCVQISGLTAHNWDNGKVTKAATCIAEGVTTYTCTDCNAIRTESVEKASHSLDTKWSTDGTNHWHACTTPNCTHTDTAVSHDWGEWVNISSTQDSRTCEICKYEEKRTHQHTLAESWSKGSAGHWHECTGAHCEEKDEVKDHDWNEWVNSSRTCKICGYAQADEHDHTYEGAEWSKNETYHWHECTVNGCEEKDEEIAHTWNSGTTTKEPTCIAEGVTTYTCTVCGQTKTESIEKVQHTLSESWSKGSAGHWHACTTPNCTHTDTVKDHDWTEWENLKRTCKICGYVQAGEHDHTYAGADWSKDETNHWHVCTVDGCEEKDAVIAHTWNSGTTTKEPSCTETGLKTLTCTACGQTKTEPIPKTDHTYNWTYKNPSVHTGECTGTNCNAVTEAPHDFEESTENKYTIYTCKDCGEALAEYTISLVTKIDKSYEAYLNSAVKVGLYSYVSGEPVKMYEETVDTQTGVATFLVKAGSYQVAIQDPAGYLHNDAPFITVKPEDEYCDSTLQLIVSSPVEYTFKLFYGAGEDNPAEDIDVSVKPKSTVNTTALPYVTGKTDENGEFKFNLGSDFGARFSLGVSVVYSGFNTDEYQKVGFDTVINDKTETTTVAVHLAPAKLTYTVKVKVDEEFLKGVTVKFTYGLEVVKEVSMDADSDTAEMGELANKHYDIEVSGLSEEISANYKMPASHSTGDFNGETVIELVKKSPTYVGTVSGTGLTEKAGIKVLLKDNEGNLAGEGTTDEEGKVYIECPDPAYNYTVCIDSSTMPAGYAYFNTQKTGTTVNSQTNTKSSTITLSVTMQMEISVTGSEDNSGITVKLYNNNVLAFEGTTDSDGKVTADIPDMTSYKVVLENLPANYVVRSDSFSPMAEYDIVDPIQLVATANFKLTLEDGQGKKLAGATVQLGTLTGGNNGYSFTEKGSGTTDENGLADITCVLGTLALKVTLDGKVYYTNETVTGETKGEEVVKTIALHSADMALDIGGGKNIQVGGDTAYESLVDKTTVINISKKCAETLVGTSTSLANGKYRITIINPDNAQFAVAYKYYDANAWGYVETTEDTDYIKFEKDGDNIVSVTFELNKADNGSWFNINITSTDTTISKIAVKVEEIKANYKLTLVDEQGEKLVGAEVKLGALAWNDSSKVYEFTEKGNGTTDENGLLDIACAVGTLALKVTLNGNIYYTSTTVTGETEGQEVVKTITLYPADMLLDFGPTVQFGGSLQNATPAYANLIDKTTAVYITRRNDTTGGIWMQFNCLNTLADGTYKLTCYIPEDSDITVIYKSNTTTVTEDNDYVKFEKDGDGNILSVTFTYDHTVTDSKFTLRLETNSYDINMIAVKVESVTE